MKALIIFFLLTSTFCFAQKEDHLWVLGGGGSTIDSLFINTYLDFNNLAPSFIFPAGLAPMVTCNASICGQDGQLLCYTNGESIYNMADDTIENGGVLIPGNAGNGGYPLPQCQLMFHYPGHPGKVIMFSGNHFYYPFDYPDGTYLTTGCKVQYSIIDMALNNGAGKVTLVEKPIINDTLFMGRFTACRHANGRDWWIIAAHNTAGIVYKFLLDPQGVQLHDKQLFSTYNEALGQAVFSPDGNYYAQYVWVGDIGQGDHNIIEIYDFDRCTGQLSNRRVKIFSPPGKPGGMAFSASSRFLYFSNWDKIFQYDMAAPDILSSQTSVATYDGFIDERGYAARFYLTLLAPDNKIYLSVPNINSRYLHVIAQPEQQGEDCEVQQHAVFLPLYNNYIIPNIPYPRLFGEAGTVCDSLGLSGTAPEPDELATKVSISPNPSSGQFTISFTAPLLSDGAITLTDISGRVLLQKILPAGGQNFWIFPPEMSNGIYFLLLDTGENGKTVEKVLFLR